MASYVIKALDASEFTDLFALDDAALHVHNVRHVIADKPNAFPCRVSLQDALVGDDLLLLPYQHQPANSPYRSSGPIFVRRGVATAAPAINQIPGVVARRLISVRAYDGGHQMIAAEVCEGTAVGAWLQRAFDNQNIAYAQLHYARQGCYACRAERV